MNISTIQLIYLKSMLKGDILSILSEDNTHLITISLKT